ncbi:MarR family transcriptional regulator [Apilactobacillus xinyiensis]|uniref:MarR family transcriptional regulator n=1 Tax=Apilactobacillus xinyiensis TaxID=2841032 RepID=UPI00201070EE|nr:MarR family transcriptional regulator [Apilactobacillus xinyiensis]MCL0330673.1 MarR family transcriptional regulator [Apilactobacillus xinyiensis]
MNNQFIKLYTEFEEKGLKPNEISVLAHLYDRMNLSVNNGNFYDRKHNGYYVIYTREELAEQINLNASTITRIIKKLASLGWIIVKKGFNAPNRFFLPHFVLPKSHKVQNTPTEIAKCNTIQTELKHTNNYTNNTVNTVSAVKTAPRVSEIDNWIKTTHAVVKLTLPTLNSIREFCNGNIEKCKYVVRLVLNARNSIARKYGLVKSELSQFESNKNLQNGLFEQLEHIFSYVKKHGFKQYAGYVTNALKDYFRDAMGLSKGVKLVKPAMQSVKFDDGKKHIKEELPEWAKDDYVYVPDKHVDEQKKARLKAMIAEL